MHCQICTREIKANTGRIAHHGYKRPGDGWQSSSCFGAKKAPYEADRSAIETEIEWIKKVIVGNEQRIEGIRAETDPAHVTVMKKDAYARETTVQVSRETFGDFCAKHARTRNFYSLRTYDDVKAHCLDGIIRRLVEQKGYLAELMLRHASWVQTHEWNRDKKEWMPVQ